MVKKHNAYTNAKQMQRYLFPHACFACRKVFRKPYSEAGRICPECAAPMTTLGRKFHTPKAGDRAQWQKIRVLVEYGFTFDSVYRATESGGKVAVPYPRTLAEVPAFVAEFQSQARAPTLARPGRASRDA